MNPNQRSSRQPLPYRQPHPSHAATPQYYVHPSMQSQYPNQQYAQYSASAAYDATPLHSNNSRAMVHAASPLLHAPPQQYPTPQHAPPYYSIPSHDYVVSNAASRRTMHVAHPQHGLNLALMEQRHAQVQRLPTPPRRRPEDPPTAVQSTSSASIVAGGDSKIQLSRRQVELLQKRREQSTPPPQNLAAAAAQPFATKSNVVSDPESPWEQPFAPSHSRKPLSMRDAEPSGRTTRPAHEPSRSTQPKASAANTNLESQRALVRSLMGQKSMVGAGSRKSTVVGKKSSTSSASRRSPKAALMKKVLQRAAKADTVAPVAAPTSGIDATSAVDAAPKPGAASELRSRLMRKISPKRAVPVVAEAKRKATETSSKVAEAKSKAPSSRPNLPSLSVAHSLSSHSKPPISPKSTTVPTSPVSAGLEVFADTLCREVASQHRHLWAAFAMTIHVPVELLPPSPRGSSKPKVDAATLQALHTYLKRRAFVECRPVSQLVNDKQYAKWSARETKDAAVPAPHVKKVTLAVEQTTRPIPYSTKNDDTKSDVSFPALTRVPSLESYAGSDLIMQTRSSSSSVVSMASSSVVSKPPPAATSRPQLSVQIPPVGLSTSQSVSSSSHGEQRSSPQTASAPTSVSSSNTVPWIGIQLRSVTNAEPEDEPPRIVPWAHVELRPVKSPKESTLDGGMMSVDTTCCETEHSGDDNPLLPVVSTGSSTVPPQSVEMPVPCPKSSGVVDEAIVVIPLRPDATTGRDDTESCVLISPAMIWQIQTGSDASSQGTTWKLPREDMEPDGMTLNMATLKVTLILKTGIRKILCFENREDCLRFATAFYNMSSSDSLGASSSSSGTATNATVQESHVREVKPLPMSALKPDSIVPTTEPPAIPAVPVVKPATSDTASLPSVRVVESSLSEEERKVLERYRALRQVKPAKDALLETMPHRDDTSSRQPSDGESNLSESEGQVADKYKKMLGMGIPLEAIQHRMALDGVSTKICDMIAAQASNSPPQIVSAGELPSSPISTFTTTTVGEKSSTSHHDKLSPTEESVADKYRLMLKMGIPAEGVRHKMAQDNVALKIAAVVFDSDDDGAPSNSTAPLLQRAVTQSLLSADDEAIAEKYRKMLKMGIPTDGVRHKMAQDEIDATIVASVLGEESSNTNEAPAAKIAKVTTSDSLNDEEESVASQYRKLLKCHVSKDLVLSRMQKEGVSDKIITKVLGRHALLPKANDESKFVSGSASTGSNLINLHWNAIEDAPLGSVWESSKKALQSERSGDISKLVELFQKKQPAAMRKESKNEELNGVGKARLLDLTRSNNIAISLKAFKEFSYKELADIIAFLDPTRLIQGERAQFVRDLIPTLTELKIVDDFTGRDDRLVPAEIWFRQLRGIKRLEAKAQVLRTMEMFTTEASEVRGNFRLLTQTCRQVMASVKLQDLLGMVLRIGNVMNEGTRTGGAAGFRFDSLLRLTQTKTSDGKVTVLDYLVMVFASKGEADTLDLASDFPDCHQASRLLLSDMTNEVKLLEESLLQCKSELSSLEEDAASLRQSSVEPNGSTSITKAPSESFAKRNLFLAAISGMVSGDAKATKASNDKEASEQQNSLQPYDNTLFGGIRRLRSFVGIFEETFTELVRQRDEALEACKDLSRYCGESGGTGATTGLLDILSQFAKSVEDALKKHVAQEQSDIRKQKAQDAKEIRPVATASLTGTSGTSEKRSIVLLVNDVLKGANPQFKEDFKKGRTLPNPSDPLKAIYDRERKSLCRVDRKLDIVSAIREREENLNRDVLHKKEDHTVSIPTQSTTTALPPVDNPRDNATKLPAEQKLSVKERALLLSSVAQQNASTFFVPRPISYATKSSPQIKRIAPSTSDDSVLRVDTAPTISHVQTAVNTFVPAIELNREDVLTQPSNEGVPSARQGDNHSLPHFAHTISAEVYASPKRVVQRAPHDDDAAATANSTLIVTPVPQIKEESENEVFLTPMESLAVTKNNTASGHGALLQKPAEIFPNINIASSQERLQMRRDLSPPQSSGSLADVMKALEHMSSTTAPKVGTKRPSETPPLPSKVPTKEKKTLSERAREKRQDKNSVAGTTDIEPKANLETPASPALDLDRRMTIGMTDTDTPSANESTTARLARKKRLQKRMSK